MKKLGIAIRQRRELLKMKQGTLATALGVKRPYLSRIERGHTIPSVVVFMSIAAELKTTMSDLAGEIQYPQNNEVRMLREAASRYKAESKDLKTKLRSIRKTLKT